MKLTLNLKIKYKDITVLYSKQQNGHNNQEHAVTLPLDMRLLDC